jgi:hypothetical protein
MTKIDDLLYKAGLTADGCWDKFDDYDKAAILRLITFTVEECAEQINNLPSGYKDYRDQIEDAFRRDCIEVIKQNFGIKE